MSCQDCELVMLQLYRVDMETQWALPSLSCESCPIRAVWAFWERGLKAGTPTVGRLKRLGRLGRGREQICLVCSAVLEAFGVARTLSAPIQHANSEKVGCQLSVPLDSLIGCMLAV